MGDFLNFNSWIVPDENSSIKIFFEKDPKEQNLMIINYWLSKEEPLTKIVYHGKNDENETSKYRFTLKVSAHYLLVNNSLIKNIFMFNDKQFP